MWEPNPIRYFHLDWATRHNQDNNWTPVLGSRLDYNEEVHQLVQKKLPQDKAIWGNTWYGGEDGKNKTNKT